VYRVRWGNRKEEDHLENIGLDRKIIIKPTLERDGRVLSVFILLVTGIGGGPLFTR